jgi:hypothetical protein
MYINRYYEAVSKLDNEQLLRLTVLEWLYDKSPAASKTGRTYLTALAVLGCSLRNPNYPIFITDHAGNGTVVKQNLFNEISKLIGIVDEKNFIQFGTQIMFKLPEEEQPDQHMIPNIAPSLRGVFRRLLVKLLKDAVTLVMRNGLSYEEVCIATNEVIILGVQDS